MLAGTCCTVLPWNRSMWRIDCGICIALPRNERMRSHLVSVRVYAFLDIIDKSGLEDVACSRFYTRMHVGSTSYISK